MQSLTQIRALLAERGLRPRRRLGQNFLHDQNLIRKLLDAAAVKPGEVVLEVGPGTGALTEALLERGARVVAVEIDPALAVLVRDRLGDRVRVVEADCLAGGRTLDPAVLDALAGGPFALVANLPYQAASPLIATLLMHHPACRGQFVTIQREVADRLVAPPGGKAYGPLGIIVQSLARVRRIATVAPSCFWPPPKVTSAMVAIEPCADHGLDDPEEFGRFVTRLFSRRRKQLGTIFGRAHRFPEGVTPDQRPEQLTVDQLIEVWRGSR